MKDIFNNQIELQPSFNYKCLYNDNRGAVFKDDMKALLYYSIKEGIVKVEKFIITKDLDRKVLQNYFEDNKVSKRDFHQLMGKMRNYHQERDSILIPFLYLLNLIEPDYKVNENRTEYEQPIIYPVNIDVGYRFENSNAFSRIFIKDEKIVINSTNDNIENLTDTLYIDGIQLYIIDVENELNKQVDVVAYKLTKTSEFNIVKDKIHDDFRREILLKLNYI